MCVPPQNVSEELELGIFFYDRWLIKSERRIVPLRGPLFFIADRDERISR